MALIKSHSNYILRKRHQEISDGTIWERDITTIGGVNQFSAGQIPIYKSSNFIITVRNDGKVANQYNQTNWKENEESGVTWTLNSLSSMTSDFEDQNDVKIILKQDYYDFCDFAYYGSLTEMFRASINDILARFPGELYVTNENAYYTQTVTIDFNRIERRQLLGDLDENTSECKRITVSGNKCKTCTNDSEEEYTTNDKYVDNPFGIDIHSIKKPLDGKELKYFSQKGYKNYQIIENEGIDGKEIESWKTRNFIKVVRHERILDEIYGLDAFYYDYLKPEILEEYFNKPDNEVWWMENDNDTITENGKDDYEELVDNFIDGEIRENFNNYNDKYRIEKIVTITGDCPCTEYSVYGKFFETLEEAQENVPEEWEENTVYTIAKGAMCGNIECYFGTPCKGYKAASISATPKNELDVNDQDEDGKSVVFGAWIGDNDEIVYLSNKEGIHIRPKEKFIVDFYNGCDNFQNIIVDRKTTPRYNAVFSVIKDNERGYYRELETFTFPTSYGNYNLDAKSFGFTEYTSRFAEIGTYYDELFTDNLYRSMTHEAIKNFDWTYTREFTYGDEEEYVNGGQKIQKALRVFAREFDEILTYINNIRNVNRVTYDERSNIPDYFLIDQAENKGWDVCLVYPYNLEEYYFDENNVKVYIDPDEYDIQQQLDNKEGDKKIVRQFSQNMKKEVRPYRNGLLEFPDGYFVSCSDGTPPCWAVGKQQDCYNNDSDDTEDEAKYKYLTAEGSGNTYYDESNGKLLNRIKAFSDERSYTYLDANNEFIRRLVINSPYIWRHKGTIEGIEMILAMFGLKSKRWVDRLPQYTKDLGCKTNDYDYDIVEYSSFAKRLDEKWDAVHQMYRIDWINSTKTITYDNRNTSNYTKYGSQSDYVPYQGLPVKYRDVEEQYDFNNDEKEPLNECYIEVSPLDADPKNLQEYTNKKDDAFKRIDENNAPVKRRFLYPDFNKYDELDGNPYFQMDGGWMSKTVQDCDDREQCFDEGKYNFQYDVDDNIAYTCYVPEGSDEDDEVIDNHPLYKETIRNIKRVDTIKDLISTPINTIDDGSIFYVTHVENGIAIVDNDVFTIKYEYSGDNEKPYRYISLIKEYDYIKIGDDKFFTSTIVVYNNKGEEVIYNIYDKDNGYEVKAYILYKDQDNESDDKPQFVCKSNYDGAYTIDTFMILDDEVTDNTTNYFIIDNSYYSNRLATNEINNGWRRLKDNDQEYIKVNTITNYYEGNNPHNGNMKYDSGHEYLTHFKRLFKYPIENELFDERCYESYYYHLENEIYGYGFENLIHENEEIKQYFPYISGLTDTKIHYFGSYYKIDYDKEDKCARHKESALTKCNTVMFYGEDSNKAQALEEMYRKYRIDGDEFNVSSYTLSDKSEEEVSSGNCAYNLTKGMIGGTPYTLENMVNIDSQKDIDDVTNQIMNNKRLTIKFYLHNKWYSKEGQCEIKYLDTVVMNYLAQMIPSTTIFDVQYIGNGTPTKQKWEAAGTECLNYDLYEKLEEYISTDGGNEWTKTGKTKLGKLISINSEECGYVEPEPPEPTPDPKTDWIEISGEMMCDGTDLYAIEKEVIINGSEQQDTGRTRKGQLIEKDSPTCSIISPNRSYSKCSGGKKKFKITQKNNN